jgi:dTDP-4-amino-4,6-dideoxygalactose transaminase
MILMNDFKAEPAALRKAMSAAAARVFESGWYVLGSEVEAFERRWAEACGVEHALGVANGLDAIELALRALGIGPGDEVITTPMTAFATALAVMRAGATPVFADIEADTGLLSPRSVRRCRSPRTRAVVLVHLYGQVPDLDAWVSLCDDLEIDLIEDCAQAHLASWNGGVAGSFGKVGAYSFYPTKNLGAIGDGGAVVTRSAELARRIGQLRNYGQSERYVHPLTGMNSRLDELQAALLSERLAWLAPWTERRRQIAAAYRERLSNPAVQMMAPPLQPGAHVHHLFAVRTDFRAALQEHLKACGVQALIHYPVPVHEQPPCKGMGRDPEGLVQAERHAKRCLSIPCHPQMTDADVDQVVDSINRFRPAR